MFNFKQMHFLTFNLKKHIKKIIKPIYNFFLSNLARLNEKKDMFWHFFT
jgi:hypothetical protein